MCSIERLEFDPNLLSELRSKTSAAKQRRTPSQVPRYYPRTPLLYHTALLFNENDQWPAALRSTLVGTDKEDQYYFPTLLLRNDVIIFIGTYFIT